MKRTVVVFDSPEVLKCKARCKKSCCINCHNFVSAELDSIRSGTLYNVLCTCFSNSKIDMKAGSNMCVAHMVPTR